MSNQLNETSAKYFTNGSYDGRKSEAIRKERKTHQPKKLTKANLDFRNYSGAIEAMLLGK